ncbi:TPR repeat family protein [Methyloversatilis sp. RAC08]|uniref:tetratricopeptide repeat protein n=1 Tax=Methyloversatilis sp. RAC08 TaxID=1842540 RepID=UPI000856AB37|nr:tetratricopeptide repeat protein [Methyloversatilis sp. RAC08]AOF81431.1 TPR repeat family protein [Methyloversatilis sp. RAC08]
MLIQCRMVAFYAVLVFGSLIPSVSWSQRSDVFSDEDFALYPGYCRAKLTDEPKSEVERWKRHLGNDNYIHMHHYCFGLRAMTLAYSNYTEKQLRKGFALDVVRNMNYILSHTKKDFFMRPDALINLGRGHQLLNENENARRAFSNALKLNPDSVDAWIALSDLLYDTGQRKEAMKVLEDARTQIGDHRKITLRMEQMQKK